MYDLITVGGGPAGCYLSAEASKKGMDVLLLEKSDIGQPLACSGHVSKDLWNFLPSGFKELIQNEIRGARFHVDDKTYKFYKEETISYAIDRIGLDKKLARYSRNQGTEIREQTEAVALDVEKNNIVLGSTDGEFNSKILAGCDGPRSFIRRSISIEDPSYMFQGILGYSDIGGGGDFVDVYLDIPDFFGWRIPREDSVEYGAAASKHIRKKFEEIVAVKASEKENIEKDKFMDDLEFHAGIIPIGPPDKTVKDRVFLVGDAAGQTKPFTGGGLVYGMSAGKIAAETIDPNNPSTLNNYEKKWRNEIGKEIYLGNIIKKCYDLPSFLQKLGLFSFEGKINVHMDRPSTLLNTKTLKKVLSNFFKPQ